MAKDEPKIVLMVEDDLDIAELVRLNLPDLNLELDHTADGETGLQKALNKSYALIILDLNLPKLGGMEICKRIREKNRKVPILMLTTKSEEVSKVVGLEVGADDYVVKPFSTPELMARIKALIRRSSGMDEPLPPGAKKTIEHKGLVIDLERRKVSLNSKPIELTPREYDLLVFLANNPGRPFTREQVIQRAFGYTFEGYEHTVSSHINRLRVKLEKDPSNPEYILTAYGYGYKFAEPEDAPAPGPENED